MYRVKNPIKKISQKLKISEKTVKNYIRKYKSTGTIREKKKKWQTPLPNHQTENKSGPHI